jgi:PAS domain S-box-containing protein
MTSTVGRIVALFCFALPVFAQQQWVMNAFQPPDNLPFEDVRDIVETADGCLWFAGWSGGVGRLSGTDWRVYTSSEGLIYDYVRALATSGKDSVWVGTELGVSRISPEGIEKYDANTLPFKDLNLESATRLASGHVWFGTKGGGIFACDDSGATAIPAEDNDAFVDEAGRLWYEVLPPSSERNGISDVLEAKDGSVWVASEESGLWVLREGVWSHIPSNVLPCFRSRSLAQDESGRIWVVGSGPGGFFENGAWHAIAANKDLLCIATSHDGDLVAGTPWGLQYWNGMDWLPVQSPQTVGTPLVRVVRFAEGGGAWVGTKEGIARLQKPRWQWAGHSEPTLADGHAFYADPSVEPLAVNSSNQVVQFRDGAWQVLFDFAHPASRFQCMTRPVNGVFYVLDGNHVHRCDLMANAVSASIPLPPQMIANGILQTRKGELFAFGDRGAFRLQEGGWARYPKGRPIEAVQSLFETVSGDILASHANALDLWREDEIVLQLGPADVPVLHGITCAVERCTGEYWVGTRGLYIYNPESASFITTREGLVSDRIYGFYESADGTMWAGSEHKGVSSYRNDRWVSYSHDEGLPSDKIVAMGEYPAGTMWVATRNYGLYRYRPSTGAPDTRITASPVTISHDGTGVFSFVGYDAWNVTLQEDLEYSWRVVSLRDQRSAVDWRPFSGVRTVATPHLPPGDYAFEVRAADKDRDVDPTPALVKVEVLSPLYARPEFYGPVAALLVLALVLGYGSYRKALALRDSEKSYRSIVNGVSDAIVVRNLETGAVVDANERLTELFGLRRCDLMRSSSEGRIGGVPYVDRRAYEDVLERAKQKPQMTELFALRRDGTPFLTEVTLQRVAIGGHDCLLETVRDVSERQATEEKMRRLAMAVEQAAELIIITDVEGTIQYVNPAFERQTGYTRDEALGQNPRILNSGKHSAPFYERMWFIISQGRVWDGRFTNKKKDGTLYEQESTISAVRDRDGRIVNYVAVARDVTHEVRMEARLRQSQKLEAIGTLAGGIAHDFNNILSPILGFSELVRDQMLVGSETRANLDEVIRAASRAKDLVHQILTFSRQAETAQAPVRMGAVVQEALRLLRATIPPTIEITEHIDEETGIVFADPTLVHQVVMNLCTNAYHAMEVAGGKLQVSLAAEHVQSDLASSHPRLKVGRTYACLSVSDTGHGMDAATLDRIFDPFFTTKEMGKGTGLGLATVHGIVMNLGGDIVVRSEVGKGTVFKVFIPQVHGKADSVEAVPEEVPLGQGERLLLVDDEQAILEFSRQMLTRLGYEVTAMSNSKEALAAFTERPDAYDVIITDHAMPDITGAQLAAEVLRRQPGTPVVLITGFSEYVDAESAAKWGFAAFVQKPFTRATIAKVVRSILADADQRAQKVSTGDN